MGKFDVEDMVLLYPKQDPSYAIFQPKTHTKSSRAVFLTSTTAFENLL